MGFRFRRSINVGAGFRVNLSKSGVGYSWGVNGYRITKKADGGVRKTYSIPGTGISWVDEKKPKRNTISRYTLQTPPVEEKNNVIYEATELRTNEIISNGTRELVEALHNFYLAWIGDIAAILIFFLLSYFKSTYCLLVVAIALLVLAILYHFRINLDYECDDFGHNRIKMLDSAIKALSNCDTLWQLDTLEKTNSLKYNSGASRVAGRHKVQLLEVHPVFLRTNVHCYKIRLKGVDIYILPDRLIVKKMLDWAIIEYCDLMIKVDTRTFIEHETVPKDATVVGYTWRYVNKDGGPDRRFKDNKKIPQCEYAYIVFKVINGQEYIINASSLNKAFYFRDIITNMRNDAQNDS